ncbi:hypothetical protein [Floridanema aerugineum]|jgi:hypothetical protein|uniref:Uncharacterized protein n=1 Tax=Floridaenema aerugineum BLCC-F46 TaxID=3153654 RepID=A0ABV4XBE2_9CYAN
MTTEKQAREQMAQQRLEMEHLQESMLNRAEAEVQQGDNSATEELARQQMTQERLEAEQTNESMLTRSEAEITE